jgi:TRAP-type C4-dicarboxylate transport system permease large subunit
VAGIIPGLILAGFYILTIWIQTKRDPEAAPAYEVEPMSAGRKLGLLMSDVVPQVGLMVVIVVLMINGFVTPSEAAAFGALGVFILAAFYRCLTWDAIKKSIWGALRVTLMAYLIVFGSATFSQLLAFSGASRGLISWATGFDLAPTLMLLVMFGVLLLARHVHGADLDHAADRADLLPAGHQHRLRPDLVRLVMLLALEISFTTPPFGLLLFVMKGVAPPGTTDEGDLQRGAAVHPVFAAAGRGAVILFPPLATWLPSQN